MKLKKYHPVTPSLRHTVLIKNKEISGPSNPVKNLTKVIVNKAGRNNKGRITIYTKSCRHKRLYRKITFDRSFLSGVVEKIEYDPNRNANIARIFSPTNNTRYYVLATEFLERGHFIANFKTSKVENFTLKEGNSYCLRDLPLGLKISNVSFHKNSKSGFARSAGTFAQIVSKNEKFCRLRLMSGKERTVPSSTIVTLGSISNNLYKFRVLGKAGRSRWSGIKPSVRGVAMNPIDHPHGGGEGKTSGGRPSVTPWGKVAHGQKTRLKKNKYILKD